MKKWILLSAIMSSYITGLFTEVPEKRKNLAIDTWFVYNLTSNAGFDVPSNYTLYGSGEPGNQCIGSSVICMIKVNSETEVYGAFDPFPGKPKVDISGAGTINASISTAIASHTNQSSRVILKF